MSTPRNYEVRPTDVCNIFAMMLDFPIYIIMSDTQLQIGNSFLP